MHVLLSHPLAAKAYHDHAIAYLLHCDQVRVEVAYHSNRLHDFILGGQALLQNNHLHSTGLPINTSMAEPLLVEERVCCLV